MNSLRRRRATILIGIFFFLLLACDATFTVMAPTPTLPPPTETITVTSAPLLSPQVKLVSVPFIETNPGSEFPPYTITAQTPQLTGSDDPRVQKFNQRLGDLIAGEVDTYRGGFQELPITPNSKGSTLEVTFKIVSQIDDLWSFKFDFSFYADGAAHPGLNSVTLNYDLGRDSELALDDLFLHNSNYLEVISKYCIGELDKQPFFDRAFTTGADPTVENYRNWNITLDGLQITFDAYQVAPGAAGPQTVVVPFGKLSALIDLQGPLANIAR